MRKKILQDEQKLREDALKKEIDDEVKRAKAIEDLVKVNFGDDKWDAIKKRSGVDVDYFLSNEPYDDAITYQAKDAIAWSMGNIVARYRGGIQNDGTLSYLEASSIIAIKGHGFNPYKHSCVALTNKTLFGRDRHVCAYCGEQFPNYHGLPNVKGKVGVNSLISVL